MQIWSITNNASAFATRLEAQAALSAAYSVNTDGYTLLKRTISGSYQPFFTLENDTISPSEWTLKIINDEVKLEVEGYPPDAVKLHSTNIGG